jgi:hypothetical protein
MRLTNSSQRKGIQSSLDLVAKSANLQTNSSMKTHIVFSNVIDNNPIAWEIGKIKSEYF